MKRDMDLIRQILLEVEQHPFDQSEIELNIEGYRQEDIAYHVMLLSEANLVKAFDFSTRSEFDWKPWRLTWEGHEFLDAARSDTTWNKAQKTIKDNAGTVSFAVLKAILIDLALNAVGLKT